jgi:phage-related protein
VFGAIGEAMDKLGPKIEQLTNWFKENEDKAKLLAGVLGGVMVIAIGAYTVAMAKAAIATIAATWPILAVIAAAAAVVAAIYLVWTNWDKIWNWIKDHPAIAAIIAVLAAPIAAMVLLIGAIKYLWENWHWIWDAIKNFTLDVWNSYIKPVWDAIYSFIETYLVPWFKFLWDVAGQVWTWISARISEVWNNVIKPIWDVLIFYVENVLIPGFGYLKDIIVTAFNIAVDVISSAWSNISRIFDFIKGGISLLISVFGSIKDGISNAFSTIYDVITWPFKTAFNFIADAWNNTVGKLEFTMPDWVPLIGGKGFKMPTIPKFHQGGIVPGPAGSETLALLEGGEMILTRGQVQAMANTPTGSNVSVVINTVAGNPIEIERIVIDAIARANRRGMTTLTP